MSDDDDCCCMGEYPEVAPRSASPQVCSRCESGGHCSDSEGCTVTPEFLEEMRRAAKTLDILNRIYGVPKWSADQIRYEAMYLERHT